MNSDLNELIQKISSGFATEADLRSDPESALSIRGDASILQRKFVPTAKIKSAGLTEGEWVLSNEDVDSMGDIIRVKGWDLTRFKENPVMLFAHKSDQPPVGRWSRTWMSDAPALMGKGEAFPQGTDEFADRIWRIIEAGGLPGVSVGFHPGEVHSPTKEERAETGAGEFGLIFTEGHSLGEVSVVPVPANAGALRVKCLSTIDRMTEDWLRNGEMTPAVLTEFKKSFTWTQEEAEEKARKARRGTGAPTNGKASEIVEGTVGEAPADMTTNDDTVEKTDPVLPDPALALANETIKSLSEDKDLLSQTSHNLLEQVRELQTRNADLTTEVCELKTLVSDIQKNVDNKSSNPSTEAGTQLEQTLGGPSHQDLLALVSKLIK